MSVTVLEDLPNDLWLKLVIYFTWVELDSTWLQWNLNCRILTLALADIVEDARAVFTLFRTRTSPNDASYHFSRAQ
jgi:hypothetical protein